MTTPTINYKGMTESYSIFYIEILIPDGFGSGDAYALLLDLVCKLYSHNPKVLLREVDDLPYGAPRAFFCGVPERGAWPGNGIAGLGLEEDGEEKVRVRKIWPLGEGQGGGGEDVDKVEEGKRSV
ncbi:hypothetical protein CLAFUW4_13216 [Fulvia fulva]|uniref:Uncharacterized protein n=1 Tax=Passalora fulva TaxID=5499 RepID=A0A9Q8PJN9_PASFU|nr:uncharacterized protein CLAFUR5_13071 [Fulvia fulva]KAK4611651.1 hypothetical protein CLAFUR4_13221 [Fulvia fulva]KAK4612520.1 hypothetical protein CLAFUR0_13225 [Fulvia fulva]UJO23671.1 hypothetical protein CLAFUR5_13071 [Fulvia fulva]WPV21076.1 hypothetical protein CLAFUW4_13216 [Fulvia fulva]WPV36274.1 hypothetical protein CLAFUW7_13223 [Fulvia fulva]